MLGTAGIFFVCLKLYDYHGKLEFKNVSASGYAAAAGLIFVYGCSNLLLALAWHNILSALMLRVSVRWTIWAYAVSQLAKYVPGNIFQFAGRQAIGLAVGLPGWPLAKSTVWELVLISLCGAVFGFLVLPLFLIAVSNLIAILLFASAIVALLVTIRVLWGARLAGAALCYLIFLGLSGLIFSSVLAIANHGIVEIGKSLPAIVGAYVIAWLAGLLTPGAPAGLGIREAVLLLLLPVLYDNSAILLAVVVGRAITVSGDLLFFAASRLVPFNWSISR